MRTKKYKGAVITILPTTREYRERCYLTQPIHFWVSVSNAGIGNVYNAEVNDLARFLNHVRERIKKAMREKRR
jgi:hypothetical protein